MGDGISEFPDNVHGQLLLISLFLLYDIFVTDLKMTQVEDKM